jgi:hypothetical protein
MPQRAGIFYFKKMDMKSVYYRTAFKGLIILCLAFVSFTSNAQPWFYGFGTGTGIHSSSFSTSFLPAAPSGTSRVRVGTGGGSLNLENPGLISLGSGSELRIVAPTSASLNKFAVYDFAAGKSFTLKFTIRLGNSLGAANAGSGIFSMFIGDGTSYSNDSGFAGASVFTGIQWVFGAAGVITTNYRATSTWTTIAGAPFVQGNDYVVEIYGNNTTGTINYTNGIAQDVAPNTFDLFVNGVLVGNNLAKAQLPGDVNIDSFMFYGETSTSNVANIFLDNIFYTNEIALTPLPVTLLTFSTKADKYNQNLSWTYESPERFDYFELEHSRDGQKFNALDRISEGAISSRAYKANYTHVRPGAGIHYYRLKMVDLDGSFVYSQVIQGKIEGSGSVRPLSTFISSEGLNVSVETSVSSLELRLVDQLGRSIYHATQAAEAGIINIPVSNLGAGVYFLQVNADGVIETYKLVR